MTSKLSIKSEAFAMIETYVVGAGRTRVQSYGLADDKGDSLGLRFFDNLGRRRPALGFVQHLVREFMDKGAELFGPRTVREKSQSFRHS